MKWQIIIGMCILILISGCNQKPESIIISKFQVCEFRMINQSYVNYTCPDGSGGIGINREAGELDYCDTNRQVIDGTVFLTACMKKDGFEDCYKEYQQEELSKFCRDVLCYPN